MSFTAGRLWKGYNYIIAEIQRKEQGKMPEKEKIIMSFIAEMQDTSPDDYMEIKLIMLAVNAGNTVVLNFLRMAFELIEARRPRLIELKGGVTA